MAPNSTLIPQFPQFPETLTLIPGLPNDISATILSYIPYCYHTRAKQTCKSWRHFYTFSQTLIFTLRKNPQFRKPNSTLLCIFPDDPSLSPPYIFDPTHLAWAPIPRTPVNPHAYSLSNFSAISVGPYLYVLGGSLFDTRSFPLDRPTASSAVFRFDFRFSGEGWRSVSPMITARGSFAAAAEGDGGGIVVAGGGSRHPMFGAAGSRVGRAERYDVERDEWVAVAEMPGYRAGCVGFMAKRGKEAEAEEEFWVMGGYSGLTTIAGVLPVDEQCRDSVVLDLGSGEWREVGDMWGDGQRGRLGKVAVVEEEEDGVGLPEVFMLDENDDICRFSMTLNCWFKETTVPRKNLDGSSFGFVAIQGELHVISLLQGVELSDIRRSRQRKRGTALSMQIYNPKKKSWRTLITRTPFHCPLDFKTAVMCTICL